MKKILILLFALPLITSGQPDAALPSLLATTSSQNISSAETELYGFIRQLEIHRSSSETTFLKKVFYQTQKKFLTHFNSYAEFRELFISGNYDCLTATSLFSIVLEKLNFSYRIIETNYHIFILVNTAKGEILLETTDHLHGFVQNTKEIQQRIGTYRSAATQLISARHPKVYKYHFDLYREVQPLQLPGLLCYNQAVKAYNSGRFEQCADFLVKAIAVYDTPRTAEFCAVFLQSVANSKLDEQTKKKISEQLKNLQTPRPTILAAR